MAQVLSVEDIYKLLDDNGMEYELQEHEAAFTMDDLDESTVLYPESDAKNIFIRDDKKRNYYLITVQGKKRVDLKEFRQIHQTRQLTFVSPEDLFNILGLKPGSVSPFGLLNDQERKVKYYIDAGLLEGPGLIGAHPNDNTKTVWLRTQDLLKLIENRGNEIHIINL